MKIAYAAGKKSNRWKIRISASLLVIAAMIVVTKVAFLFISGSKHLEMVATSRSTHNSTWLIEYGYADDELSYLVVSSSRTGIVRSPMLFSEDGESRPGIVLSGFGKISGNSGEPKLFEFRDGTGQRFTGHVNLEDLKEFLSISRDDYSIPSIMQWAQSERSRKLPQTR